MAVIGIFPFQTIVADTGNDRSSASFYQSFNTPQLSANYLLLVRTAVRDATTRTSSAVVYNGQSMTAVPSASLSHEYATGVYQTTKWWYLLNPTTAGSNLVSVTYTGVVDCDVVSVFILDNVNQFVPFGVVGTNTGNSNTPSLTLTTTQNNSAIVAGAVMRRASGGGYTPGGTADELTDGQTGTTSNQDLTFTDLFLATPTAGSNTASSVNGTSSAQWSIVGFEVLLATVSNLPRRRPRQYLRF